MASKDTSVLFTTHTTIQNIQDLNTPLVTINTTNITKLTTTNYITWSLQIRNLLEGYDLYSFVNGSHLSPTPTVTANGTTAPNPAYNTTWKRQDRLLFSSLLGAVSLPIQPLFACTTTSQEAWTTLANTYAKSSRGHIKQIKDQLKNCVKGSKRISEYMQFIKNRADELALLGKPIDNEDQEILDQLDEIDLVVNFKCTEDFMIENQEGSWKEELQTFTEQSKPLEDYYRKQKKILEFQIGSAPAETWQGLLTALNLQHINAAHSSQELITRFHLF